MDIEQTEMGSSGANVSATEEERVRAFIELVESVRSELLRLADIRDDFDKSITPQAQRILDRLVELQEEVNQTAGHLPLPFHEVLDRILSGFDRLNEVLKIGDPEQRSEAAADVDLKLRRNADQLKSIFSASVRLTPGSLERHVQAALVAAASLARRQPINSGHVLMGVMGASRQYSSDAFGQLAEMLLGLSQKKEVEQAGAAAKTLQEPKRFYFSRGLKAAYEVVAPARTRIWGRDLITVALLTRNEPELDRLASEAGTSVSDLRKGWLTYISETDLKKRPKEDWIALWQQVLGAKEELSSGSVGIAGYNPDASDDDLLVLKSDYKAMARLLAAKDVDPPLAIGLFGHWGAGKTFFMQKVRQSVDKISEDARGSGRPQREIDFYKRIVQIEFNAWHYAESNLWASLVDHILSNLRVLREEKDNVLRDRQDYWIEKMDSAKAAHKAAEEEKTAAQMRLDDAEAELKKASEAHEEAAEKIRKGIAQDILTEDLFDDDLKQKAIDALEGAGFKEVGQAVGELVTAVQDARSLYKRTSAVLLPILRAEDGRDRMEQLISVLVFPPLLGALLAQIPELSDHQSIPIAGALSGFLGTAAAWIKSQVNWISKVVPPLEQAQQKIDAVVAKRKAKLEEEIQEFRDQLERRRLVFEAKVQGVQRAEEHIAEVKRQQEQDTPAGRMAQFIEERTATDDYSKHLGILALIRRDFSHLSDHIKAYNAEVVEPDYKEEADYLKDQSEEGKKAYARFLERESKIFNRIVLYIDDLDRCPEEKVAQVLQAIHLLLAFPLFVVVVGVDPRWISRVLEKKYRTMLRPEQALICTPPSITRRASAQDYMEKIFQIPYWLQPIGDQGRRAMIKGLVVKKGAPGGNGSRDDEYQDGESREHKKLPANSEDQTQGIEKSTEGGGQKELAPSVATPRIDPAAKEILEPKPDEASSSAADEVTNLTPPAMHIEKHEADQMDALAVLLGDSPRAVKRFVNLYRLYKSSLTSSEVASLQKPCCQNSEVLQYHLALFMLSVITGMPSISRPIFRGLLRNQGTISDLVTETEKSFSDPQNKDIPRLNKYLKENEPLGSLKIQDVTKLAKRMARYSFRIDLA